MLPKSKNKHGYTRVEMDTICEQYGITKAKFYKTLGINTGMIDKKGNFLTYSCDVERALHQLGIKDGVYHPWD